MLMLTSREDYSKKKIKYKGKREGKTEGRMREDRGRKENNKDREKCCSPTFSSLPLPFLFPALPLIIS
jgi:hypothetical protein